MAVYYNDNTFLYLDGQFVKAAAAKVDLYGQSMHYGYAVFEGIRSYRTITGETKIFKAPEHFERLRLSAEALYLPYPHAAAGLIAATYELLAMNGLQNAYIRPLVYGPANMSFNRNEVSFLTIQAWEMTPFLGDKLLRVMTSSFQRPNPAGFIITAKASGHYVNSILASQEAKAKGFDEALLTDMNGFLAEGPGANMFYEKDGELFTPATGNILPGITRATVFELCKELGIKAREKEIRPEELKTADAAFFCGTAAEVIGWDSIDEVSFRLPWADTLSRQVQLAYAARIIEQPLDEIRIKAGKSREASLA